MSTRKEKADKKRKDRATPAPDYRIDKVDTGIKKPEDLDARVRIKTPAVDAPDMPTMASVQNPTDIKPTVNAGIKSQIPTGAEVQNPTGLPTPTEYVNPQKPSSPFSDMLAPFRENIKQEKTDAVKMQKYYALTDALNALGKMGGTAIGGAIGGGVLDSAPAVAEYQPSRGYIDAFERARKANDRLRALDEQEFQLEYNRKQKEENRAYQAQKAKEDRAYKEKADALDRQFRVELAKLNAELAEASAQKDFERTKALKESITRLQGAYDIKLKEIGQQTAQMQHQMYNTTPVRFKDGTTAIIPDNYYNSIKQSLIGETINGVSVTKDNVEQVIRKNPEVVNEYLSGWGISTSGSPVENAKSAADTIVEQTSYSGPSSRVDYADQSFKQALESGAYDENENSGGNENNNEMSQEQKLNKWRNRN